MDIEASRQMIIELPIDVSVLANLRETARLAATHYSTQIEGNRLTKEQVALAIGGAKFPGRARDEAEVRNYYRALHRVEELGARAGDIAEADLQRIHGIVHKGKVTPSPYRDGQNVIRDAATGGVVYMPPEPVDVPVLMSELFEWINRELDRTELPLPIVGALAHYQYATIHPYYDGNGRAARLLTTLILHKTGYDLKGIYSLEEHYARNLAGYYAALTVGPSHNYYLGRAEADVTGFVDYFCASMAAAFAAVRVQAYAAATRGGRDSSLLLRRLDPRQRQVLGLFRDQEAVSSASIAQYLDISTRAAGDLCRKWVETGFLQIVATARKSRSYSLTEAYEELALRR